MIVYGGHVMDQVTVATAGFIAKSTDPKAQIITVYTYVVGQVCLHKINSIVECYNFSIGTHVGTNRVL